MRLSLYAINDCNLFIVASLHVIFTHILNGSFAACAIFVRSNKFNKKITCRRQTVRQRAWLSRLANCSCNLL